MFIKFFVITVSVILFIIIPALVLLAIMGAIVFIYEWGVVLLWIIPWLMLVDWWISAVRNLYLKSKKVKIIINENTEI